jgi:hypothetical protein
VHSKTLLLLYHRHLISILLTLAFTQAHMIKMQLLLLTRDKSTITLDPILDLIITAHERDILKAIEDSIRRDKKSLATDLDWNAKRSQSLKALKKCDHPFSHDSSNRKLLITALLENEPTDGIFNLPLSENSHILQRDDIINPIFKHYNDAMNTAPFITNGTFKSTLRVALPYLATLFKHEDIFESMKKSLYRRRIHCIPWSRPPSHTGRRPTLTSLHHWRFVAGPIQGAHALTQPSLALDSINTSPIDIVASQASAFDYDRSWSFLTLPLAKITEIQHLNSLPDEVLNARKTSKRTPEDQKLFWACYEHLLNKYDSGNIAHKLCVFFGYLIALIGNNLASDYSQAEKRDVENGIPALQRVARNHPFPHKKFTPVEDSTGSTHAAVAVIVLFSYVERTSPWRRYMENKQVWTGKDTEGFFRKASK